MRACMEVRAWQEVGKGEVEIKEESPFLTITFTCSRGVELVVGR